MSISEGFINYFGVAVSVVDIIDMVFKFNIRKPILIVLLSDGTAFDESVGRSTIDLVSNPAGTAERKAYYFIGMEVLKENMFLALVLAQFGSNAYKMKIMDQC